MKGDKRERILRILKTYGAQGATVRQISIAVHRTPSGTAGYLRALVADGLVSVVGRTGCAPIYALKAGVEVKPEKDIFEQCRENWHGYRVHKVFGAGGAVRLQ